MSDFKQSLKKKLNNSNKSTKGNQLELEMSPVLVSRLLPKKEDKETVLAQAKGSPPLLTFLRDYLYDEILNNTFTEGYGEERAFHDGKAYEAKNILNLLKGLSND